MSGSSFRGSRAKAVVREQWDTPFLRYLNRELGVRYRYMGFPGTDLEDIKLWRDMIDEVIAFQSPAPGRDPRAWITAIRMNLRVLGIPGVAYFGSLEEVMILRKDLDGTVYEQREVITLYNLDFCDEIASRVDTREGGKEWRFEALRVIVQDQSACFRRSGGPSHFIILLTVRNQIGARRIRELLRQTNLSAESQRYYTACNRMKPIPGHARPLIGTHAWSLKAFLYDTLRMYFGAPNVSALFFPLVKYHGTPIVLPGGRRLASPMLHWTILCRLGPREQANPRVFPPRFLSEIASVEATDDGLAFRPEPGENHRGTQPLGSAEWFIANRPPAFDFAHAGTGGAGAAT